MYATQPIDGPVIAGQTGAADVCYQVVADLVLLLHASFVTFVFFGLVLVILGGALGWRWVRNPWFRSGHLGCIAIVVGQDWFGIICPLTTLEMSLRSLAGDAVYAGSFVAHWVSSILYYQAPAWVFTLFYSLFGLAVIVSWFGVRPRSFARRE